MIVAPNFDAAVVRESVRLGMVALPGVMTPDRGVRGARRRRCRAEAVSGRGDRAGRREGAARGARPDRARAAGRRHHARQHRRLPRCRRQRIRHRLEPLQARHDGRTRSPSRRAAGSMPGGARSGVLNPPDTAGTCLLPSGCRPMADRAASLRRSRCHSAMETRDDQVSIGHRPCWPLRWARVSVPASAAAVASRSTSRHRRPRRADARRRAAATCGCRDTGTGTAIVTPGWPERGFVSAAAIAMRSRNGCSATAAGNCNAASGSAAGDRDRDGIPNRMDRDRDGDGVPNAADQRPNDPHRR